MNKKEFLDELRVGLAGLPESDLEERLNFYEEMIDDRIDEGLTEEEAIEEANFVLEQIAPYKIDCPGVCDMEMIAGDNGRADSLTPEQRTKIIKIFCDTIANAGYTPMIYMNLELAAIRINLDELEEYDKWFAYYNPEMYFPYKYKVWQYSEKGKVAGISEPVDMNIAFEPIWK